MVSEDDYRKIKSIMIKNVLTAGKKDNLLKAVEAMSKKSYSCIVVVDSQNRPIGVLTERDLLRRVITKRKDSAELEIGEVMTTPALTVPPDAELVPAGELMKKKKVRRFPVVDDDGKLIGLVTETDIMEGIIRLVKHLDWKLVSMKISVKEYIEKLRESRLI